MSKVLTFLADRQPSQYVTVFDGETLFLLEDVSNKVARTALDAIQNGQAVEVSLGEKAISIPVADITRVRTAEHDDFVQVRYDQSGVEKYYVVAMPGHEEQLALVRAIGVKLPKAQEVRGPIPVAQALIGPGFATLGVVGVTTVFLMLARDIAAGAEIDTSGRRAGMKILIANVLDKIGTTGVIGIGVLALAGALFWGYKRAKSPPILTTWERKA